MKRCRIQFHVIIDPAKMTLIEERGRDGWFPGLSPVDASAPKLDLS